MGKHSAKDPITLALARLQSADDLLAGVEAARELRSLAEAAELQRIRSAREAGVAWAKIGKVYGLTKQGAQQRFAAAVKQAEPTSAEEAE